MEALSIQEVTLRAHYSPERDWLTYLVGAGEGIETLMAVDAAVVSFLPIRFEHGIAHVLSKPNGDPILTLNEYAWRGILYYRDCRLDFLRALLPSTSQLASRIRLIRLRSKAPFRWTAVPYGAVDDEMLAIFANWLQYDAPAINGPETLELLAWEFLRIAGREDVNEVALLYDLTFRGGRFVEPMRRLRG